jgi:hypothetical protein
MMDINGKSIGGYLLRIVAGVAIIFGVLMLVSSLARGDLFGIVLAVILIAGGAVVLKRPGRAHRPG